MSEKIAIITTGGTIGAALGLDVRTLGDNAGARRFREFIDAHAKKKGLQYEVFAPLKKFSEDFQPEDWGAVLEQINVCKQKGYSRIVVAHGTDTLAYTSYAASLYNGDGARICFACSFIPPSEDDTDAFQNTAGAIAAVTSDALSPGVYVSYRATPTATDIFRAADLKPMDFDQTAYTSIYGRKAARVVDDAIAETFARKEPVINLSNPPSAQQLRDNKATIIQMPCYPGMSFEHLQLNADGEALVILHGYHSGTMPAVDLRPALEQLQKKHPKAMVVLAAHPAQYVQQPYETTAALERDGLLRVYADIMPHQLYTLAVCETAQGKSIEDALLPAEPWRFRVRTTNVPPTI